MSASMQTGEATRPTPNGNGHAKAKPGRKPGVKAAAKTAAPPLSQGIAEAAPIGKSEATIVGRIGPAVAMAYPPGSIASQLFTRQQELEIELRVVRSMIAQFAPRRPAATRKSKSKKAARRAAVKQAA
jgi:hypothetical protein